MSKQPTQNAQIRYLQQNAGGQDVLQVISSTNQKVAWIDSNGMPQGNLSVPGPAGATGPAGPMGAAATGLTYVDITDYGARAFVSGVGPSNLTGTIGSGSNALQVNAIGTFINGDGVTIYGAGATNSLSTPGSPTVTPSLSSGIMGNRAPVVAPAGSTSYSYKIVARTKNGGLTAAGSAGGTSTGSTLGPNTVNISSVTRSGNTVTVNCSSAHGLSRSALVFITGVTDTTFNGSFIVASIVSGTVFTFTQGMNTLGGASTGSTGGTVTSFSCNLITWAAVTNAWQYYIYGRTSSGYNLLGATRPGETSWEDYGATMMANIDLPDFVPSTAPASGTNDNLSTTIVSGANTKNWVLAATATNPVSGATVKFDVGPCIANADAAAVGNGTLYIPPATNNGIFVVNSHLILSSKNIIVSALMILNETLELSTGTTITGEFGASTPIIPQFAFRNAPELSIKSAYPGVYSIGTSCTFRNLVFTNVDQGLGLFLNGDSNFNAIFTECSFVTGSSADYTGSALVIKGMSNIVFRTCLFSAHLTAVLGETYWPVVFITDSQGGDSGSGELYLHNCFCNVRSIGVYDNNIVSGELIQISQHYAQGLVHPLLMMQTGNGLFDVAIDGFINDTSFTAALANFGSNLEGSSIANIPYGFGVTGNPIIGLRAAAVGLAGLEGSATILQNYNIFLPTYSTFQMPALSLQPTPFASLPSPTNGTLVYCSDCTKATPCGSGGTGALAKGLNGAWDCD